MAQTQISPAVRRMLDTYNPAGNTDSSRKTVALLSGWPTPNAIPETRGGLQTSMTKALERRQQGHALNLDDAVCLVSGWLTPSANEDAAGLPGANMQAMLGSQAKLAGVESLSAARTEKRGALNPRFSLWLMGFPTAWALCAEQVTPSSRKSVRSSSAPSSKHKPSKVSL